MDTILQIVRQEDLEKRFNRKHIDGMIRDALNVPDNRVKIEQGVILLDKWIQHDGHHDSKKHRISQLLHMDLTKLVTDLFVGIAYVMQPQLFTSVTAQLASRMGFSEKRESIQTVAEVLSVLCMTDAYDITKADKMASLMIQSRIYLPDETKVFIENSEYLPPMVCEPLELKSNYDSGYLTHKDSLILGQGNHHNGNICLDVLNKMNRVRLKLDVDFLRTVEEEPTFEMDTAEKRDMWLKFKRDSTRMYALLATLCDEFYLTHKVDKRGRIYAQGYHISTQGSSYKKAMIELSNEEVIEGVPSI